MLPSEQSEALKRRLRNYCNDEQKDSHSSCATSEAAATAASGATTAAAASVSEATSEATATSEASEAATPAAPSATSDATETATTTASDSTSTSEATAASTSEATAASISAAADSGSGSEAASSSASIPSSPPKQQQSPTRFSRFDVSPVASSTASNASNASNGGSSQVSSPSRFAVTPVEEEEAVISNSDAINTANEASSSNPVNKNVCDKCGKRLRTSSGLGMRSPSRFCVCNTLKNEDQRHGEDEDEEEEMKGEKEKDPSCRIRDDASSGIGSMAHGGGGAEAGEEDDDDERFKLGEAAGGVWTGAASASGGGTRKDYDSDSELLHLGGASAAAISPPAPTARSASAGNNNNSSSNGGQNSNGRNSSIRNRHHSFGTVAALKKNVVKTRVYFADDIGLHLRALRYYDPSSDEDERSRNLAHAEELVAGLRMNSEKGCGEAMDNESFMALVVEWKRKRKEQRRARGENVDSDSDDSEDNNGRMSLRDLRRANWAGMPRTALIPAFVQPGVQPHFQTLLKRQKVVLENAFVEDDRVTVRGIVRVLNMDFHKAVYVRWTVDDWRKMYDYRASYLAGSHDEHSDQFAFNIYTVLGVGESLCFAVRFHCAGEQFWDNNYGANYRFVCRRVDASGNVIQEQVEEPAAAEKEEEKESKEEEVPKRDAEKEEPEDDDDDPGIHLGIDR